MDNFKVNNLTGIILICQWYSYRNLYPKRLELGFWILVAHWNQVCQNNIVTIVTIVTAF